MIKQTIKVIFKFLQISKYQTKGNSCELTILSSRDVQLYVSETRDSEHRPIATSSGWDGLLSCRHTWLVFGEVNLRTSETETDSDGCHAQHR